MAALETQEVVQAQAKQSVWMEDLGQHRQRLNLLDELYRKGWDENVTPEEKVLARIGGCPRDLMLARQCLECEAHFTYQTETRMRRQRSTKEWSDAGLPTDHTDFYQDARLDLVVRFDEELRQFVPMTTEEYLAEYEQSRARHANQSAQDYIESWNKWVPCFDYRNRGRYRATPAVEPVLYKRGTNDDIYKEIENKRVYGGTQTRKKLAKEEWGTDKSTLVQNPVFDAYQIRDGYTQLVVRMFDGERFVDAWQDNGGPGGDVITLGDDSLLMFRKCPAELFCIHQGQKYAKPGSVDAYKWEAEITNPLCEFEVDAAEFLAALKHGAVVASHDESRPILCAVFLTHENGNLKLVSTDTYRMLIQDVDAEGISPLQPHVLLPRTFCAYIAKAMKKPVGKIKVRYGCAHEGGKCVDIVEITGEVKSRGKNNPVQFLTRIVEGQFVNYGKVIPGTYLHRLELDPQETTETLKQLGRVAALDNNRVVWEWQEGRFAVEAHNAGEHITVNEMDNAQYYTGPQKATGKVWPIKAEGDLLNMPPDFALNCQYVVDYLSWQEGPVALEIFGPLNSFTFRNGRNLYVQMPMLVM